MRSLSRYFWPLFGLCALLAALILVLMPQEKVLGQIIKLVYLHGALSRAGMIGFWAAGIAGAVYLLRPSEPLLRWSRALLVGRLGVLDRTFPRQHARHAADLGAVDRLGRATRHHDAPGARRGPGRHRCGLAARCTRASPRPPTCCSASRSCSLVERTGVLRHPLDPIGTSPSATLRLIYLLLLLPIVASMFLAAWRLTGAAGGADRLRGAHDLSERGSK